MKHFFYLISIWLFIGCANSYDNCENRSDSLAAKDEIDSMLKAMANKQIYGNTERYKNDSVTFNIQQRDSTLDAIRRNWQLYKDTSTSLRQANQWRKFVENSRPVHKENENLYLNKKYVFCVLHVTQRDDNSINIDAKKKYFSTSDIYEEDYFNDEVKYKLLDQVQKAYKNTPEARLYNGEVIKRECFSFDSYSEASKAREKYTIDD